MERWQNEVIFELNDLVENSKSATLISDTLLTHPPCMAMNILVEWEDGGPHFLYAIAYNPGGLRIADLLHVVENLREQARPHPYAELDILASLSLQLLMPTS